MGNRKRGDTLYTLVFAVDRCDSGKAWLFYFSSTSKRKSADEFLRKRADQRRTRCIFFPVRRTSGYLWGERIYSMGLYFSGVCKTGRSRSYTLYSDRFLFLYRRSTGSEDSTASFHAGIECTGAQTSAFVWKYNFKESDSIRWGRAGVFPCRCRKIPSEKRLNIYRTYVVWCDASERTGAGRPLFRNNPPENRCFYAWCEHWTLESRGFFQDTAQWGGTGSAWTGTDLCRSEYCGRSQPDCNADIKADRMRARNEMSPSWKTICRRQRFRKARQLVDHYRWWNQYAGSGNNTTWEYSVLACFDLHSEGG